MGDEHTVVGDEQGGITNTPSSPPLSMVEEDGREEKGDVDESIETTEVERVAPLDKQHPATEEEEKKKKAHTPSFENWLIDGAEVFGSQDASDAGTSGCTSEPAGSPEVSTAEEESAREADAKPSSSNVPLLEPTPEVEEAMPDFIEPMTLVSGEVDRGRDASVAGTSPSGQVDEEALKLRELIESLKETLSREECVGRQRHQGDFLLKRGQDLLAQRRVQAAAMHHHHQAATQATSHPQGRANNAMADNNNPKKKNAFDEALDAEASEQSFLRGIKQVVNALLEGSFKGGSAQTQTQMEAAAGEKEKDITSDGPSTGGGGGDLKVVYDNEHVWKLCSLVEAFLSKGMRAQPLHPLEDQLHMQQQAANSPRSSPRKGRGWIKGLRWMVSKPQPFNVLYAAEQYGVDLGLKVITPRQNRSIKGVNKLHAWVRNCLIEGTLATRLDILVQQQSFLKIWYDDSSTIRSEDSYSYLVGSLRPLKELQFNILLWPAQEFQQPEQTKSQLYFSASGLREKKNEILLFEKSVRQFQDQEKLVTVIGEHSPGLHDIDEILSSPVSPSKLKGKGKKRHSRKGKNKKRLVGATEIGQEKLERAEMSKALDDFSFDQALSLHATTALSQTDPVATKVGFEVQKTSNSHQPGEALDKPSSSSSNDEGEAAKAAGGNNALLPNHERLSFSSSVLNNPTPPPSALSLNMNRLEERGEEEGLQLPSYNNTSSSSIRSESSLGTLSGRESSNSGPFLNLSLEDTEMLSPRLVNLDLEKTEAMLDNLESRVASSFDKNANNFLLDKYEIDTSMDTSVTPEEEEKMVLEQLEIAKMAKSLEENEHHNFFHSPPPAAGAGAGANVNVVEAVEPTNNNNTQKTYEDIMNELPDLPADRVVVLREEEQRKRSDGNNDDDDELSSLEMESNPKEFGCTHFGTDYLMDNDGKALHENKQEEEGEMQQQPTKNSSGGVEGGLKLKEGSLLLVGQQEQHQDARAASSSESQAEETSITEQSSEVTTDTTTTSVADLHTLGEIQSVLLGSEERQEKSHGTLSSPIKPGAAGILNVGILGVETHGDRWKSYTVYQVYVQSASGPSWLLRKRYSDFVQLHKELKHLFKVSLPKPWEEIKLDKFLNFGHLRFNASVIEERRELLQECLRVACSSAPPLCTAEPLLRFLSPETGEHGILEEIGFNGSNQQDLAMKHHPHQEGGGGRGMMMMNEGQQGQAATLGQSVRLLVEEPRQGDTLEQLQIQHGRCAGCSCRIRGSAFGGAFEGAFGGLSLNLNLNLNLNVLHKTQQHRTCEYTRQLYCSKCHSNTKCVLPWSVLQEWDFRPRKVSNVVQEYLSSIFDQPILCISAIKPQLYGRISLLNKLREQRIGLHKRFLQLSGTKYEQALLQQLGSKSYLVENTEFWSMKDLVDISKGAFADLPGVLNHVATTLQQLTWDHLKSNLSGTR